MKSVEQANEKRIAAICRASSADGQVKRKLKAYMKKTAGKNKFQVSYTYSQENRGVNEGRLLVEKGIGLQSFPANVRAYIAGDYYHDLDIQNCLPTLLMYLFARYHIACPNLKEYIMRRPNILEERQMTKQDVLELLLYEKRKVTDPFFEAIHSCIYKTLIPLLRKDTEWTHFCKKVAASRAPNVLNNRGGSLVSQVICCIENRALQTIITCLKANGFEPEVMVFDGVMVAKKNEDPFPCNVLKDCQGAVLRALGVELVLVEKPMRAEPEFLESITRGGGGSPVDIGEEEELCVDRAVKFYEEGETPLVEYLNNYFAKITHESSVWYCNWDTRTSPWLWRTQKASQQATEHLTVMHFNEKGKEVKASLWAIWCTNPLARTYKHLVFDPSYIGDKEGLEINLFQGFAAERLDAYDAGLVQPWLYHLKEVLNNGNEDHFLYVLNWAANIVQNPALKNGTAIVNFGAHGTGKNIFWEFFGEYIIGMAHYGYVSDMDDLTCRFNSHTMQKLFIIGDEITFAGGHKQNNKLKSLLTQATQKSEKKGAEAVMTKNYANFYFSANEEAPVRVENTDRRYMVKRASEKHRTDFDYFDKLLTYQTQEVANHLYTYLMSIDLSSFDVRRIPHTEEKDEMREYTMTPIEVFVHQMLSGQVKYRDEYSSDHVEYFEPDKTYRTTMSTLFDRYQTFCNSKSAGQSDSKGMSIIEFSRKIRRQVTISNVSKQRKGGTPILLTVTLPTKGNSRTDDDAFLLNQEPVRTNDIDVDAVSRVGALKDASKLDDQIPSPTLVP
ncbi:hypothetical protein DFJ77DRAFT_440019 [Powellomyces hirtus]|nr:hypothetical protein DFJ77DRAFT_440019 [Powellomyces hirtus]